VVGVIKTVMLQVRMVAINGNSCITSENGDVTSENGYVTIENWYVKRVMLYMQMYHLASCLTFVFNTT
jgi:hypothetical protein